MILSDFNLLTPEKVSDTLRPCVDIPRWIAGVADARPFDGVQQLLDHAAHVAPAWTDKEIDRALSHHPRIGEKPAGASEEANLSRQEQAGLSPSEHTAAAITAGNIAYERKFGRVFLIRAAGRTAPEILQSLTERLGNHADEERQVVARELRDIALIRLQGIVRP
jgi:2-oxo-4-hydroxy-4-carboxy-5-ureidoimidazoline decarboxylase